MSYIWGTRHPMVARQKYVDAKRAQRKAYWKANPDAQIKAYVASGILVAVLLLLILFSSAR